ncbi:MAG TPA: ATP-grasp domain-containing protein [Usitatibacter sp.]|nr:ATP-grasp domain-containing protein [Usitatibacter sp.]
MKRRVLFLFPDEWDRAAASDPRYAGRYEFLFEGFDLFSFPDNARLFTFDALRFVERMARKYSGRGVESVVTSDEQFGPFLASLIAERLGLPHTPVDAVLRIQHKYYARQAFERIAPEANSRTGLLRRDFGRAGRPEDVPMPFPFYVKPAKAAFSVLARRVDSFEELHRHTRFGRFERAIIDRLVQPFADVMRAHSDMTEDPFSMVCEEILRGRQVTANGLVRDGRVTMLGTVDSVMYPGTDQFQRFQYPSSLGAAALGAVDALAIRLVEGLGFRHGLFNVEMRLDPASGQPRVIEINPRAAGQFFDLFERVDGYSLFEAMLDLHAGREPRLARGEGASRHAASFVWRDLTGQGLSRWPRAAEIKALAARHPDAHLMVYPKRGADLAREMKWLGSYRYAVFNVGAPSLEELSARYRRLSAEITFHPRGHRLAGADVEFEDTADERH